jgi:hypothetical protein
MTTFKKISGIELTDIHDDDLRKIQAEITFAIENLEKEKYNKLFQNVIKAINDLIDANLNRPCFDDYDENIFNWEGLKGKLTEYHFSHYI